MFLEEIRFKHNKSDLICFMVCGLNLFVGTVLAWNAYIGLTFRSIFITEPW